MAAWRYADVIWGETECQRRACPALAELLFEGLPLCLDCADELTERGEAVERYPALRVLLPAWDEH